MPIPQRRSRTGRPHRGPLVIEELESRLVPSALPRPTHVVVVIEENELNTRIIGAADAPYINSLAQQGALMTASSGVEHPSQPNYLDLFSGGNQGVNSDAFPNSINFPGVTLPFTTPNLGAELLKAGDTFASYSETLPAVGDDVTEVTPGSGYARKHNPTANWTDSTHQPLGNLASNVLPATVNQPFTNFPTDFTQLPTVSLVVPNLTDDMHDGTPAQADTWLQTNINSYVQWAKTHNSLLVVTWDETGIDPATHTYYPVNAIPTILVGPMVQPGSYGQPINHFNVLRTLEDMYGLPAAGASAGAAPITAVWQVTSTPGVFDPTTDTWYLRGSNGPGAPDAGKFAYGAPAWIPVVGDWDGNGTMTIGVVDPATETWYLRNSNSAGGPDFTPFRFGAPGWVPVVGDWTGSGHTGIGVVDPTTGTWYLRTEVSPGGADAGQFRYGAAGWIPVVGDWTGSGRSGIGMVDPATGTWYLRNEATAGAPDAGQFRYGAPGWKPVVGDWDGSGKDGIGVVDPNTGIWYLRNENSVGAPDAGQFAYGAPGWLPVIGEFKLSEAS